MTTTQISPAHVPAAARVAQVARVHTKPLAGLLWWPLGIGAAAFAIAYAIIALVDAPQEANFTGGVSAVFFSVLGFYIVSITQTFPFAVGLGVTRRDFFASILLVGAGQVLVLSALLFGLALVERATDGFGLNMLAFDIGSVFTSSEWVQFACIASLFVFGNGIGLLLGAIQFRYRMTGIYVVGTAVLVALGALAVLVTWAGWWGDIGSWFVSVPVAVPMVVMPLAVGLAAIAGAWALLRRATV
ncbi:ABC transporter permease [Rhodococcus rhodnii]|uniref:ABC transporter permease n=2 Tax=Rhodococcus rhodnii TaxID=38312 RepID=R7WPS9_9NOCA|nr:hypothetical protein [Rhodococcus rhodnii]EOM76019.1 ABC transporter permease [Rhodococcus rhodnii LMG 5362]TXG90858.1 ABC transporter permease [Rhodococcus rhodnii]